MTLLPLKRLVDPGRPITYGIVQAGPDVDGGIPYIRPIDMDGHRGVQDPSGLRTTSHDIALQYRRSAVRTGDIVVSIGPSFGKTMTVPTVLDGANLTQGTARVAPTSECDARYLRWALQTTLAIHYWETAVGGATFRALNLEPLSKTPVPLWPLLTQRAIADYLDAETARIDALIAKKRRLVEVLEERAWLAFEASLRRRGVVVLTGDLSLTGFRSVEVPSGWRIVKLSSALRQLTNGYVGPTRDILRPDGIRYVQGLHVKNGMIDFDRHPYHVDEGWHLARRRTALQTGDVVIVQTGDIGQVAVIPDNFGEANCHALLIARANLHMATGEYIGAYLQSRVGYNALVRVATGALHPHLEFGIRDVPLVLPPVDVQGEIVQEVRHRRGRAMTAQSTLTRQITLLLEHRQALITAAVTGEIDVPGAEA